MGSKALPDRRFSVVRVTAVQNVKEVGHPVLVQRLAAAVMNWPLASAAMGCALVIGMAAALGWAALDGLARLVG
jgi:hypothetical protein